jgi:hypothetical protein
LSRVPVVDKIPDITLHLDFKPFVKNTARYCITKFKNLDFTVAFRIRNIYLNDFWETEEEEEKVRRQQQEGGHQAR